KAGIWICAGMVLAMAVDQTDGCWSGLGTKVLETRGASKGSEGLARRAMGRGDTLVVTLD
ncbi:MAG: hypothetical protein ACPGUY_09645, partial [Akkermansiaceae bacterium]